MKKSRNVRYLKKHRDETLSFSFFILLSFIATFPLIFKMSTHIYGSGGDSFGAIWSLWWYKYTWINHISSSFCPLRAAPLGLDLSQAPFSFLAVRILPLLTLPFDEIFAYNFYVLISFPLSAITMYYLARHFTKNSWASMVAGIVYGFCPYHFIHAHQHLSLANIQWIPLYVLSLFKLDEERSYRCALFCALAFSLVFLSNYYYGYFMTIFTGVFIVWRVWYSFKRRSKVQSPKSTLDLGRQTSDNLGKRFHSFKVFMVAVGVALAIILPAIYPILKNIFRLETGVVVSLGYERAFSGLFTYSAQLFHYLIPSGDNPFIGGFTRNFIKVYHPVEQTLYLGWVGIILSIVAVREWRRKNRKQRLQATGLKLQAIQQSSNQAIKYPVSSIQDPGSRSQKAVSFFLFAGIVALIFSHAPWTDVGPFRIFFPSYFLYKIAPMFRCYARFGILVMLSVSILAGIGLACILQKIKSSKKQRILVAVIILLVFIEFAPTLPVPMLDAVNPPPVYEWLTRQPGDFIVAEYPVEDNPEYLFWQRVHEKRLVNAVVSGTYADKMRKEIVDILNPKTSGILSYLGAKYVIFHPGKYAKSDEVEIIGQVPDIKRQSGLRLVKTFPEARVYEVVALPTKPID